MNTSRSLALGANGTVAVTGSSDGDIVTVVYREVLPAIAIDRTSTGIRLHFTGEPGHTYQIERARAVDGPWEIINQQTTPLGGLIEYHDINLPPRQAFYRTMQP